MTTPRNFWAHLIASLGGLIVLTELLRYWLQSHEMEGAVIAIGCLFGFVGAYMSDRKGALEGGQFIVDSTVKLVGVIRSGRRSTDAVVVPPAPVVVAAPTHDPSTAIGANVPGEGD